ncbi:preprotein translocase subunit SecE [Sphingomonas bacterium]|uniref:preprotein translocase subunit SecE n=1 Tax=Sphingomonas bacterium TaxID=1895847 RepID=UPI001576F384|nr:preprotein translocase subunit SecE [Sphingomonas bacterium]
MAKTTPAQFARQVEAERRKVAWPTWKETWLTALMVAIMTTVLAVFFLGVDSVFEGVVTALLKLAQ